MTYTFTTDDKDEAAMMLYASEAWATLSHIRHILRSRIKHDTILDVDDLYHEVCTTLARLES